MSDDRAARGREPASDAGFSRDEVLGGLPARWARTLLFLVESRVAHLVDRGRRAAAPWATEASEQERDIAFLEAFALGRESSPRPTIQDLERHAPEWAALVPENPRLQAALAHALGEKYEFARAAVPGVRAAVGLDDQAVQRAYRALYRRPLETIYAARVGPLDGLRWRASRLAGQLESLPPFWTAFALTLTETVGAGVLALPIALAGLGPLPAVVCLVALGAVSMLTMACMSEAVTRSGLVRYANAFHGRLVSDYLGGLGSGVTTLMLAVRSAVILVAYYAGVSSTLADVTGLPPWAWAPALLLVGLYLLSRRSLHATVASALLVGAVNLVLLLAISALAIGQVRAENLLDVNVPLIDDRPFDPALWRLVFGVTLSAYFGHVSLANCARVVLRRDPGGRSLTRGSLAAQATAILLYSLWVAAVSGAVPHAALAGHQGTALEPLADELGPVVLALGTVYVVLAMGMASVHVSFALFNLARERLPTRSQRTLVLPRSRGRLLFRPSGAGPGDVGLGLSYLGLGDGRPRFRLELAGEDGVRRADAVIDGRWRADELPALRSARIDLRLEVLEADEQQARVRVDSPLRLTFEGDWTAIDVGVAGLLTMPDVERGLVSWMLRRHEVSLDEVAAHIGVDKHAAIARLRTLARRGVVVETGAAGEIRYRASLGRRPGRRLPEGVRRALDEPAPATARRRGVWLPSSTMPLLGRGREVLLGDRGRFWLAAAPVVLVFVLVEALLLTDSVSFAGPLAWNGVIAVSLFAGLFPTLLLVSSRRKGELRPAVVFQALGHPLVVGTIYLLFVANVFLHGLLIWQGPLERASTVAIGVLMVLATVAMVRRGAFARRAVVALRDDPRAGRRTLEVLLAGQPLTADAELIDSDGERARIGAGGDVPSFADLYVAAVDLPAVGARELRIWAHRVGPDGESHALPAALEVIEGDRIRRFDPELTGGHALLPVSGGICSVRFVFRR